MQIADREQLRESQQIQKRQPEKNRGEVKVQDKKKKADRKKVIKKRNVAEKKEGIVQKKLAGKKNKEKRERVARRPIKRMSLRGEVWWEEGGKWSVQIASFRSASRARELVRKLKVKYGFPAYVVRSVVNGKTVWRVRVGKLKSRKKAKKLLAALERNGFKGVVTF